VGSVVGEPSSQLGEGGVESGRRAGCSGIARYTARVGPQRASTGSARSSLVLDVRLKAAAWDDHVEGQERHRPLHQIVGDMARVRAPRHRSPGTVTINSTEEAAR
jgi:hypothetical protein